MNLKFKNIILFVKDIDMSKRFYTELLEQEIYTQYGKIINFKSGISIWELSPELPVVSALGDRLKKAAVNPMELYFESENLEQVVFTMRSHVVRTVHEIREEPWGQRTIRFWDPDDHLIEVGETLKTFITRFHKQGYIPEQIAEKTAVDIELIKKILKIK
jgi:catechol 2,3-dioxygenase-like lactoylglutathione lyase family enzyme